eukprot:5869925-Pleurochrysis_carterae.AAC.1
MRPAPVATVSSQLRQHAGRPAGADPLRLAPRAHLIALNQLDRSMIHRVPRARASAATPSLLSPLSPPSPLCPFSRQWARAQRLAWPRAASRRRSTDRA